MCAGLPGEIPIPSALAVRNPIIPYTLPTLEHLPPSVSKLRSSTVKALPSPQPEVMTSFEFSCHLTCIFVTSWGEVWCFCQCRCSGWHTRWDSPMTSPFWMPPQLQNPAEGLAWGVGTI